MWGFYKAMRTMEAFGFSFIARLAAWKPLMILGLGFAECGFGWGFLRPMKPSLTSLSLPKSVFWRRHSNPRSHWTDATLPPWARPWQPSVPVSRSRLELNPGLYLPNSPQTANLIGICEVEVPVKYWVVQGSNPWPQGSQGTILPLAQQVIGWYFYIFDLSHEF